MIKDSALRPDYTSRLNSDGRHVWIFICLYARSFRIQIIGRNPDMSILNYMFFLARKHKKRIFDSVKQYKRKLRNCLLTFWPFGGKYCVGLNHVMKRDVFHQAHDAMKGRGIHSVCRVLSCERCGASLSRKKCTHPLWPHTWKGIQDESRAQWIISDLLCKGWWLLSVHMISKTRLEAL